jgi:chromosome segregation ATPase
MNKFNQTANGQNESTTHQVAYVSITGGRSIRLLIPCRFRRAELSMLKDSSSRELSTLNSDLLRAQFLNEDFQRRLRDLSETKANLSEESGALKSKVEITERMKEGLGGERDYYKSQVHELNGTIHHLKLDLQQRADEIALLQRQIQSQEVQLNESIKDRSRIMQESQKDAAAMRALEATITDLKADLQQTKHQNANLNDIVVERNEIMNNISDMNVTQRGLMRTNEKMKIQIDAVSVRVIQ